VSVSARKGLLADVPRSNGELVFAAPWAAFRTHLVAAIADLPEGTPYDEAWVEGLERLVTPHG
jgi:hypothetical protein